MSVIEEVPGLLPTTLNDSSEVVFDDLTSLGSNSSLSSAASKPSPRDFHPVEFYLFPVIILIGTVCNILTFIVMRRKKMRHQSTYFYMAVLAIADEMVLIVGCLNFWVYLYTGKNVVLLSNVACKIVCVLLYGTFHFSVWTVVIMTIERFIAVALPLQASHLCTVKRAKMAIVMLALIILLVNVHFLFTHALVERHNEMGCQTTTDAYEMFMHKIWPWIDASVYSFIPLTLLIIFNILIISNLLKASKSMKKFHGNNDRRPTTSAANASIEQNSTVINSAANNNSDYVLKEYPLNSDNANSSLNLNSRRHSKGLLVRLRVMLMCCLRIGKNSPLDNSNTANSRANANKRVYKFKHIKTPDETASSSLIECKPLTNQTSMYHQQQQQQQQQQPGGSSQPLPTANIGSPSGNLTVNSTTRRNTSNNVEKISSTTKSMCASSAYLSAQQQAQQAQSSAASRRLTIMLLLVSLTFFVTSTPIVTLQTVEQAKLVAPSNYLFIVRGVFLILQYLNHSANFFLYAVTGKTFRKEFFALFKPCRSSARNGNNANANKINSTTVTTAGGGAGGMAHTRSSLPHITNKNNNTNNSKNGNNSRLVTSNSTTFSGAGGNFKDGKGGKSNAARHSYAYTAVSRMNSNPIADTTSAVSPSAAGGNVRITIDEMS